MSYILMSDKSPIKLEETVPAEEIRCIGFYEDLTKIMFELSLVMRKPAFCICENIDADQLRDNREADQRLCFHYRDSKIPLLPKSEISSL